MRKYLLFPLIVVVLLGIFSLFFNALRLNFEKLFIDYVVEVLLLIAFFISATALTCHEIYSFLMKNNQKKLKKLQKEKDSYQKRLEEVSEVDVETQRLRAIIQHKKDSND